MYATDDLRNEHEGIEIAIQVLDTIAGELEAQHDVSIDDLEQIVDFLKTFADKCHHSKEEDLLFPALEKAGVLVAGGPIGVMLDDHTKGRDFIRTMGDSLPKIKQNDIPARNEFAAAAHGYAGLLRDHISNENTILFVIAEQKLTPKEHETLSEGFERIEQERIGPGVHERYHKLLDELNEKYLKAS